jgi:hypothetical protein
MTKKQSRREKRMKVIQSEEYKQITLEKPESEEDLQAKIRAKKPTKFMSQKEPPTEEWRQSFLDEVRAAIKLREAS